MLVRTYMALTALSGVGCRGPSAKVVEDGVGYNC